MCFTVPSSWSILNKKTGRVKVVPIYRKIGNREPYESGYRGIALLNRIQEFRVRIRVE